MTNTYTSNWIRVSNGDVTTHNPQELVGTNESIVLSNTEVQWEGVNTEQTETVVDNYDTNRNSVSDTVDKKTDRITDTNGANQWYGAGDKTGYFPDKFVFDYETGSYTIESRNFVRHELKYQLRHDGDSETYGDISTDVTYEKPDGTSVSTSVTLSPGQSTTIDEWTNITTYYGDEGRSISSSSDMIVLEAKVVLTTVLDYELINTVKINTNFPYYDSGVVNEFDRHYYKLYLTNDSNSTISYSSDSYITPFESSTYTSGSIGPDEEVIIVEDYTEEDKQGDAFTLYSETTNITAHIVAETRGVSYTTETTVYNTENPRATRDVTGTAGDVTLNDGTQTAWKTLSGLEPDQGNEFYHDIDGSGEAYFRFRFDWEPAYPTALKQLRVSDVNSDTTYKVALADPNDTQLQYDVIRTSVNGTTYAIDVVDSVSDTELDTHRMYHPTHGTLYLRPYEEV